MTQQSGIDTSDGDTQEGAHALTAIVTVSPKEAFKVILIDCLTKMHTGDRDPEFDACVEKAWRAETGTEFLRVRTAPSSALWGPPGHGKSTICRLVGQRLAQHLGLEFVKDPPRDFQVTQRHFLMTTQEMSGSVSNVEFAGIPAKATGLRPDGSSYEFMEKLLEKRIMQLRDAGAGILLFDDFANASEFIQNNVLSIAEEGRFQGLDLGPRVMPLLTANLGAVDGTHTGRVSTATMTRVRNLHVYESVDEFALRTQLAFRDMPYQDVGICSFLKRNTRLYDTLDPTGPPGPHSCPRSLTKLIDSMRLVRRLYESVEGRSGLHNPLVDIPIRRLLEIYAKGLVGAKAGQPVVAYGYSLITEAEPLAAEAMSAEGLSVQSFQRLRTNIGDGQAAAQQTFAYQFAIAVAERAAELIARSPSEPVLAIVRFARATLEPDFILDTTRTLALSHVVRHIIELNPGLADPKDKEVLRPELARTLIRAVTDNVKLDEYFVQEILPDVLSGYVATTSYASGQRAKAPNPRAGH